MSSCNRRAGSAKEGCDRAARVASVSTVTQRQVAIESREFTVYDEGDPVGPAILVHHGTPAAGPPYAGWVKDANARGARLIAYDRPGYGASTAAPGRTIGAAALDAAAIMDALGVQRFATWGVSGGGPHALACAALLPDRVTAACSIAGVGPFDADGLNYFSGMGNDNLVEFGLAMAGREHIGPFLTAAAAEMLENLEDLAASIQTLVAEPDRIALSGPIGEWWAGSLGASFSTGADGWIDDDLAFVMPFGFEIGAVSRPTLIVHGHRDLFVPISHGQWLSQAVPRAESWLLADEAHLSLLANWVSSVHEWLLDRFASE
jgi:pimeloyl-ACP methyl ester carboxylesterase